MMMKVRMAAALGRPQVLAIVALVLIWTLRWRWSNLDGDFNWVKEQVHATTTTTTTTGTGTAPFAGLSVGGQHHQPPLSSGAIDLSDPDAPFVGWPLQRACAEVEDWVEGVVFLCDNNFGGVGNVRNFILTCIRYAIEAGATGLVMPRIRKRKDDDIADIMDASDFRPFGYLFDELNFRQAMGDNCPQITLFDTWADVPHVRLLSNGSGPEVETLDPRELDRPDTERCDFAELDHNTDRFHCTYTYLHAVLSRYLQPSATNAARALFALGHFGPH